MAAEVRPATVHCIKCQIAAAVPLWPRDYGRRDTGIEEVRGRIAVRVWPAAAPP